MFLAAAAAKRHGHCSPKRQSRTVFLRTGFGILRHGLFSRTLCQCANVVSGLFFLELAPALRFALAFRGGVVFIDLL